MDNIAILLKGVGFALLAWIGIQVATTDPEYMILTIKYNSLGYYLIYIMPMISLIWGINLIYVFIRKNYRHYRDKYINEIKERCDA